MIWLNGHNCLSWCRAKGQARPFFVFPAPNKQC
nr:MAG TPA: hypothetical protein [Caudoviricetes sp.]